MCLKMFWIFWRTGQEDYCKVVGMVKSCAAGMVEEVRLFIKKLMYLNQDLQRFHIYIQIHF